MCVTKEMFDTLVRTDFNGQRNGFLKGKDLFARRLTTYHQMKFYY